MVFFFQHQTANQSVAQDARDAAHEEVDREERQEHHQEGKCLKDVKEGLIEAFILFKLQKGFEICLGIYGIFAFAGY